MPLKNLRSHFWWTRKPVDPPPPPEEKTPPAPVFKKGIPKFQIEEAFSCEGIRTYQCKDINDLPALRGLMTHQFYEQTRMKYTFDEFKNETELEDAILGKPKITAQDILDLKMIVRIRRERMVMPAELETVLNLASVVYVDEGESWIDYDHAYNKQKIERWMRNPEILAFFLGQSIRTLHAYMKPQEISLQDFLKTHDVLKQFQNAVLLEIRSKLSQPQSKKSESPSPDGSQRKSSMRPSVT